MRIAFITPEYVTEPNYDGGLANYLHRVTLALREAGHDPIVIVGSDRNESFEHRGVQVIRTNISKFPYDLHNRLFPGRYKQLAEWIWQSWKLNRRLRQIHRRHKIDVAHFTSYSATALFRPKYIPAVVRISSLQSLWDQAYENYPNLPASFLYKLEIISLKKADRLMCPSRVVAHAVEKLTGKPVKLIEGPYLKQDEAADWGPYNQLLKEKNYALFFGSVGLLKGVKVIADILFSLLENHRSLFFVFVGKDTDYKGNSMMSYVWEQAGIHRDRVLYLGKMRHKQLYPIIEQARFVVLPSRIDNFPNTCIEAMAHGKITIGTAGASFEQLINDGENGFLCRIDDRQSLLDTIEKALNLSADEKHKISARAKERISQISPDIVLNKLISIYEGVSATGRHKC